MSYVDSRIATYLARAVYAMERSGKRSFLANDVPTDDLDWCGSGDEAAKELIAAGLATAGINGDIELTKDAREMGEITLVSMGIAYGEGK